MTTVYLVSDGSYSEFCILCVCSTREKAERAREAYAAYNDVEERQLDDFPATPPGRLPYGVQMRMNGDIVCAYRVSVDMVQEHPRKTSIGVINPTGGGYETGVVIDIWAKDESHAKKAAGDRRIQMMAADTWPKDNNP